MGTVGLLYVGAILFINGMALMGLVRGNGAVPLNFFVGLLQVLTPTYLIFTADGNTDQIFGASGLYLFGFTYLYVAFNTVWGFDGTGLGWFSFFVAIAAVGYAVVNIVKYSDYAFGVIWLQWAFLWWLFYLVLAKGRGDLTWFTGGVTALQGWITAAIPAFMLLIGAWQAIDNWMLAAAEALVAIVGVLALKARSPAPQPAQESAVV